MPPRVSVVFSKEDAMLRSTTFLTPTLAALLLCAACGPQDQAKEQQAQNEYPATTQPSTAERTAAEAANEMEQAAAPNATITPTDMAAGIPAADVQNPQATLATAAVKSPAGEAIGEVRSVSIGSDGKVTAVNVEVGGFLNVGERVVAIDADKFTYLQQRNILVAQLSKDEVEKMPAVTQN
jgi:hypothetical protein